MLRHKATIQAARYAFGLSGIYDPDEGERIQASDPVNITPKELPICSEEKFAQNQSAWKQAVESGKKTVSQLIATLETKTTLTDEQINTIESWGSVS